MKIGIDAQKLFNSPKNKTNLMTLELLKSLQRVDGDNEYRFFINRNYQNDVSSLQESKKNKIIWLPKIPNSITNSIARNFIIHSAAKKEKFDILHFSDNVSPLYKTIPSLLTIKDIDSKRDTKKLVKSFNSLSYNVEDCFKKLILNNKVNQCETIITTSIDSKKKINNLVKVHPNRIKVLQPGIDSSFTRIKTRGKLEEIRNKYQLPKRFIFSICSNDIKKNINKMMKGYYLYLKQSSSHNLPLVISNLSFKEFESITELLNINIPVKNIFLPGNVCKVDLPAVYSAASMFLYPATSNDSKKSVMEAMACETPVVTSNGFASTEIHGDAVCIVNPNSIRNIAYAIRTLSSNPFYAREIGVKGNKKVKHFSWDSTAKELLKIYRYTRINWLKDHKRKVVLP